MTEAPLIRLCEVEKSYGRSRVLRIGLMELRARRSILVCGGNGSGKSTLLRVLAGIGSINAGCIERDQALQRARLGFLPQHGGLYPNATVSENLTLRRRLFGLPEHFPGNAWYLDAFGLGRFAHLQVQHLSGGYQRLVAIAATFHIEPNWVLLDEPFASIDAKYRSVLEICFARVARELALFVIAGPSKEDTIPADDIVRLKEGELA